MEIIKWSNTSTPSWHSANMVSPEEGAPIVVEIALDDGEFEWLIAERTPTGYVQLRTTKDRVAGGTPIPASTDILGWCYL